jgi:hypothetical protein
MVALFIQAFEHLSIYLRVGQGLPQISQGHVLFSLKLILCVHDVASFSVLHNIYR